MEIFENKTKLNLENAIKVGTQVPKNAATLAWFESREVTPSNNLVSLDLSNEIPENSIDFDSRTVLTYADELGILRTIDGDSVIPSRDINISNLRLNTETLTQRQSVDDVNPADFVHYFYVSRYFIAAPLGLSFSGIDSFSEPEKYSFLNIKVIDSSGREYVDINTQRRKYRILLENYRGQQSIRPELGYKIIVLLDSSKPIDLKLVYDKVEIDDRGNLFNQFLSYEEPINACSFFEEIPEESEIIDPVSRQDRKYSIKKYRQKLQSITPGGYTQNGYQIFTPKKAVTDNRTYETYNWRLIARSNNPVDLENIPYSSELEDDNKTLIRTVKVGVLYSSEANEGHKTAHPYIFARLEQSPFNLSKFRFANPIADASTSRDQSRYWLVDIDTVEDLTDFDILAWSPTGKVLNYQAAKIRHFLNASGTLVADLSYPNCDAGMIDYSLSLDKNLVSSDQIETNFLNKIVNRETSGGFTISNDIFESLNFGIHGFNQIIRTFDTINKKYPTFSAPFSEEEKIVSITENSSTSKPIAIHVRNAFQDSSLNQFNIVGTTFSLFSYCNNIYSVTRPDVKVNDNNDEIIFTDLSSNIISPVVEGPFKFLYNIVCYGLYSKTYSLRTRDLRSSLYNYISRWQSSWVMDEKALLPEEKNQYFLPIIVDDSNEEKFARNILEDQKNILAYYQQEVYNEIPEILRYRFAYNETVNDSVAFGNVDFFIESTNPDVEFTNAEKVDADNFNIPVSYTLFKVVDPRQNVYAYTNVESPLLEPYPGMGPYIVVDKSIQSSSDRAINNLIDPINYFATYPYDISSMYYYFQSEEKAFNFKFSTIANGTARVWGNETYTAFVCNIVGQETISDEQATIVNPTVPSQGQLTSESAPRSCRSISSRSLSYARGINRQSFGGNHGLFPHTGDVNNILNTTWQNGSRGAYVAYIQYTANLIRELNPDLGAPISVDGIYGSQTESAIRGIQSKFNAITIDGKVDSETKFILATNGWTRAQKNSPNLAKARFDAVLDTGVNSPIKTGGTASYTQDRSTIQAWIRYAAHLSLLDGGNITTDFKMITYSGNLGPGLNAARNAVRDIVTFEVPQGLDYISKVGIETGAFPDFKITRYGYSKNPIGNKDIGSPDIISHNINIAPRKALGLFSASQTISPNPSGIPIVNDSGGPVANLTISLGKDIKASDCRYFYIEIEPGPSSLPTGVNARSYSLRGVYATGKNEQRTCPTTGPLFWSGTDIPEFFENQPYSGSIRACGLGPITYELTGGSLPSGISLNTSTGLLSGTPTETQNFNFSIRARNNQSTLPVINYSGKVGRNETTVDVIACSPQQFNKRIPINVQFTVNNDYTNLTPANPIRKKYDTNTIKQEQYITLNATFTTGGNPTQFDAGGFIGESLTPVRSWSLNIPVGINFSTNNFSAANGSVNINFSSIDSLLVNSLEITSIEPDRPIDLVGLDFSDYINFVIDNSSVIFTTSASYYEDSEYNEVEVSFDGEYFIINEAGHIFKNQKKLVSTPEGVLRFCKEDGSPFGLISAGEVRTMQSLVDENREVDYKYGYFFVKNNTEEDSGLVYGFYDNKEKAFIGKTISYFGLKKRGLDNVYIGVKAIDADGNSDTVEDFLGPPPNKVFTPTKLPLKMLAPVFSMKYNNSSIIRVNNIRSKLNKFTTWPLVVSNGSFNKKVLIENRKWNDWKNNFIGQELLATYSTVNIPTNTWSALHGHGKVDIRSEEPILISERKIQTRLYPILNVRHPAAFPGEELFVSQIGIIKPEISVYTRSNVDSPWQKVPYSLISKIDSYNGVVEFSRAIVPSDESLVKVDYVVDSKDSYLYQIENETIPFNPLFMGQNYNFNQPIYVYIIPTNIYVPENISRYQVNSLRETGYYSEESVIKIGTDSSVFDKFSINYDPFALLLAVVYVVNNPLNQQPNVVDLRTRGGGLVRQISQSDMIEIDENIESYWDVYAPSKEAYPRGGYAIIRIPEEVKNNFQSIEEIYSIVRGNLTAGLAFELQDMEGNEWRQD